MVGGPLTGGSLQPGPLVRRGAGLQRMGRRLALPRRPDRRLAARGRRLRVRDRARRAVADRAARSAVSRRQRRKRRRSRTSRAPAPKRSLPPSVELPLRRAGAAGPGATGRAGAPCSLAGVRRVTFSRNFTLSLSRTCQCYCKYCAFATHRAHVHPPESRSNGGSTRRCGATPRSCWSSPASGRRSTRRSPRRLADWGHEDFTSYVVWACERALERGMLPHTNLGVLGREDLARLREVTASQGLMLESVAERLMETVHAGSPTKHPARAPGDDRGGGRAEDPLHERDPGRDRRDARTSGSSRCEALAEVHERTATSRR